MKELLRDKKITICITGGIASYKVANLCSFLVKQGAMVRVVMSTHALRFITPLTFKALTNNPVVTNNFDNEDPIPHITLGTWSDLIIVAPATANIIAKAAHGLADDIISTLLVASQAPKLIVPAMNTAMYENPITQNNMNTLLTFGYHLMEADSGRMACGTSGRGRYPEIERIIAEIVKIFSPKDSWFYGKKIIISAGGTREAIDPVRYISNSSSGKTAFAFAEVAIQLGAFVHIVCGQVDENIKDNFIKHYGDSSISHVSSAQDMYNEIEKQFQNADALIMAAAVADYAPKYAPQKIKKSEDKILLELHKTTDILTSITRRPHQKIIGFAAETENLEEYAQQKLNSKNLDIIIANPVSGKKNALGSDSSEFQVYSKNGTVKTFSYGLKKTNSLRVLCYISDLFLEN